MNNNRPRNPGALVSTRGYDTSGRPVQPQVPPNRPQTCAPPDSAAAGFTRLELLVTLAILMLLTLVNWPAQAQSRVGSQSLVCLANIRRLTQGWQMFADDNSGQLPLTGSDTGSSHPWVGGWLDYSSANLDNTNSARLIDPRVSSMGPYTRDASLYRCPADSSTVRSGDTFVPRVRSCSMNAALGTQTFSFSWLPAPPYRLYRRQSDLGSPPPAQHFVIIDEHPASINDNTLLVTIPSAPAQARLVDYPASWHNGGAGISFADGRAEIHRWLDPRTKPDRPSGQLLVLDVPSPNNPDVLWLAARASSRAP